MTLSRSKYRRIPDLYTEGVEVELRDGNVMWLQVLNPFEMDEARHDGQVARSRIVMALKDFGSDELGKVKATFWTHGNDLAIQNLLEDQSTDFLVKATDAIANDPDWKERLELAERQEDILAKPETDPERELLEKINRDYIETVEKILSEEREYMELKYKQLSEEQLIEEYVKLYVERRGTELGMAEHRLTEIWYGARACEGKKSDDGWNHEACEGHKVKVFETKIEVRDLPEELQQLLFAAMQTLNMTVREAKNLDSQPSSSESSPAPSAEAASTVSIPDEIPVTVPGI